MPPGNMNWYTQPMNLPGFPNVYEAIVINYAIHSGRLPNGTHYSGTSRTAYLPNNKDGQIILSLFAEAFRRKLTFKVGTSITTGV